MEIEVPTAKSLYIEMYFDETLLSSGTAILAANNRESHCALITNRHNVVKLKCPKSVHQTDQ